MNLVQIQERLKDAPVQAIMQYANGQNPMVPPYLALAELKRRESINQGAQAQQAMQQGQPRSVKEQIEQTAGLAALQQQMQQQGMQGLMAQARPQGIPEGGPQPQRQPESEGIAGLPAGDFNFADGGIVAFQGGGFAEEMAGAAMPEDREARRKPTEEEVQRTVEELRRQGKAVGLSTIRDIREGRLPISMPKPATPATAPQVPPPMPQELMMERPAGAPPAERRAGSLPPPGGIAGNLALPSQAAGARSAGSPQEPVLAAPARGIAALPGAEEAQKMMLEQMRSKTSFEEAAAERKRQEGLSGLAQPYGEERMKRIQQMEAERQKSLEDRGLERLMRVMSGMAGRGLRGAGPAYLQSVEAERAADAAFRKQMDELMGGVEEKRRAEAVSGMTDAQKRVQKERELGLGAAEKVYDAQRKREDEVFKIRLENQLRTMQPTEASILLNVMADIRRRNPELSEADVYAKAREAQQGASPESRREETRRKYAKDWNDIIGNILLQKQYKEMGIDTFEKYLRYVGADTDKKSEGAASASSSAIPPIPAGAVRLKGAQ